MNTAVLELMNDDEFCNNLVNAESEAKVKELFKQHGVDITQEEFDFVKQLMLSLESELKKLNTEQLQAISGGIRKKGAKKADEKSKDGKGISFNDIVNGAEKTFNLLSGPVKYVMDFWSNESKNNRDHDIKKIQINQGAITERHSQSMQTVTAVAVIGAVAGVVYYGLGPIKKWWSGK